MIKWYPTDVWYLLKKMRFKTNGCKFSNWKLIQCFFLLTTCLRKYIFGVPQESVLNPILFCTHTTKLANILHEPDIKFKLFADDTLFYFAVTDAENASQSDWNIAVCEAVDGL